MFESICFCLKRPLYSFDKNIFSSVGFSDLSSLLYKLDGCMIYFSFFRKSLITWYCRSNKIVLRLFVANSSHGFFPYKKVIYHILLEEFF